MNRREVIKNLVASSGILLMPVSILSSLKARQLHLVIIGQYGQHFIEEYIKRSPIISCTSIGWDRNSPFNVFLEKNMLIDFDFSVVKIEGDCWLNASAEIPQSILDVFNPDKKYLLLADLVKSNTILIKAIIHYLQENLIDFRFLGTTPLFNIPLTRKIQTALHEFDNDFRIKVFDLSGYFIHLRSENHNLLATEAFEMLDNELINTISELAEV